MKAEEFRKLVEVDSNLKIEDACRVRWTNCYRSFEARGQIAKLNRQTIVVTLTEPIQDSSTIYYAAGRQIKVPRISDWKAWTPNNCILEVGKIIRKGEPQMAVLPKGGKGNDNT